jgi:hypothetical protein
MKICVDQKETIWNTTKINIIGKCSVEDLKKIAENCKTIYDLEMALYKLDIDFEVVNSEYLFDTAEVYDKGYSFEVRAII